MCNIERKAIIMNNPNLKIVIVIRVGVLVGLCNRVSYIAGHYITYTIPGEWPMEVFDLISLLLQPQTASDLPLHSSGEVGHS